MPWVGASLRERIGLNPLINPEWQHASLVGGGGLAGVAARGHDKHVLTLRHKRKVHLPPAKLD